MKKIQLLKFFHPVQLVFDAMVAVDPAQILMGQDYEQAFEKAAPAAEILLQLQPS